jgi:hypothetical protein
MRMPLISASSARSEAIGAGVGGKLSHLSSARAAETSAGQAAKSMRQADSSLRMILSLRSWSHDNAYQDTAVAKPAQASAFAFFALAVHVSVYDLCSLSDRTPRLLVNQTLGTNPGPCLKTRPRTSIYQQYPAMIAI